MSKVIQITTTCNERAVLDRLAVHLVENNLAACVQIGGPIHSVYQWEGKIQQSDEWICTIKSFENCCETVIAAILDQHPYDVPEIITSDITVAHQPYYRWMVKQIKCAN